MEDMINRTLSLGNFGAKTDKLLLQLSNITKSINTVSTEKVNQLSSLMDQMSKLIDDVMEEK